MLELYVFYSQYLLSWFYLMGSPVFLIMYYIDAPKWNTEFSSKIVQGELLNYFFPFLWEGVNRINMPTDKMIRFHFVQLGDPWLSILHDCLMITFGTIPAAFSFIFTIISLFNMMLERFEADFGGNISYNID